MLTANYSLSWKSAWASRVFLEQSLLVHTPQRQPDAYVWPPQQTMSLLIQTRACQTGLWSNNTRATPCQMHQRVLERTPWSWLRKKCVYNLTDFTNLVNSWEYAESTSCWQSWCHPFSRPRMIHPGSRHQFSTCVCWGGTGQRRGCSTICPRARAHHPYRKSLTEGKLVGSHTPESTTLSLQRLLEWRGLIQTLTFL